MRPPTSSSNLSRYRSPGWSSSTSQTYSGPLLSLTFTGSNDLMMLVVFAATGSARPVSTPLIGGY